MYVSMYVCIYTSSQNCSSTFVFGYENVQGMRRVEHARAQGLASLRTSLTPALARKKKKCAQGKELRCQCLSLHLQLLHRKGGM